MKRTCGFLKELPGAIPIIALVALIGFALAGCGGDDPTTPPDDRTELTAGSAVHVAAAATTANAAFTGAAGLTLTAADFSVTTGGDIGTVSVNSGTVTVPVSFAANTDAAAKTYTVGIASGSAKIKGGGTVTITQAGTGGDATPPANVTGLSAAPGDTQVSLSWTEPADTDFARVEITWTPGGTTAVEVAKGTTAKEITGLTNGTAYTFTVTSVDNTGNKSAGETVTGTPAASGGTTAPANVTGLSAASGNTRVTLSWTEPADTDFARVEITWTPGGSTAVEVPRGTTTQEITGLTNGRAYTFTVKSVDNTGNKSAGETVTATPAAPDFDVLLAEVEAALDGAAGPNDGSEAGKAIPLTVSLDLVNYRPVGSSYSQGRLSSLLESKPLYVSLIITGSGRIRQNAFQGNSYLTAVSGAGITSIGESAFRECTALETVDLPAATDIGAGIFYGCTALETVDLPAATDIGGGIFSGCTALETVSLPLATSIGGSSTFSGCTSLETVSLPLATSIVSYAFSGCTALETVSLPLATSIGGSAFQGCTALETVDLPLAASIDYRAFSGCTALETVSLPLATDIGWDAFQGCTVLETVSLPLATSIGDSAFQGCTVLETVDLPAAASIGDSAFQGCTALETVDLPLATFIGDSAFQGCTVLETVDLPAAAIIGVSAFSGCTALETLSLPAATFISSNAFIHTGEQALTITLGSTPPAIGSNQFVGGVTAKPVTVKAPYAQAGGENGWEAAGYTTSMFDGNAIVTIESSL